MSNDLVLQTRGFGKIRSYGMYREWATCKERYNLQFPTIVNRSLSVINLSCGNRYEKWVENIDRREVCLQKHSTYVHSPQ